MYIQYRYVHCTGYCVYVHCTYWICVVQFETNMVLWGAEDVDDGITEAERIERNTENLGKTT